LIPKWPLKAERRKYFSVAFTFYFDAVPSGKIMTLADHNAR
jgi:hypothetical protein